MSEGRRHRLPARVRDHAARIVGTAPRRRSRPARNRAEGTDLDEITHHLTELPHVQDVHDLHVWSITTNPPVLSAHLVVSDG